MFEKMLSGCFAGFAYADRYAVGQGQEGVFIGDVVAYIERKRVLQAGGLLYPMDSPAFVPADAWPDFENFSSLGDVERIILKNDGVLNSLPDFGEIAGGRAAEMDAGG